MFDHWRLIGLELARLVGRRIKPCKSLKLVRRTEVLDVADLGKNNSSEIWTNAGNGKQRSFGSRNGVPDFFVKASYLLLYEVELFRYRLTCSGFKTTGSIPLLRRKATRFSL